MSLPGFDDWLDNHGNPGLTDEMSDEAGTNEDPEYYPVSLSCGHDVWGTDADIDSGIRKHLDTCPNVQTDENEDYEDEDYEDEER